jgi:ABC-type maltose transport system permease subunit
MSGALERSQRTGYFPAGMILIPLPILVPFVLFQRQIITALLQGSVKV